MPKWVSKYARGGNVRAVSGELQRPRRRRRSGLVGCWSGGLEGVLLLLGGTCSYDVGATPGQVGTSSGGQARSQPGRQGRRRAQASLPCRAGQTGQSPPPSPLSPSLFLSCAARKVYTVVDAISAHFTSNGCAGWGGGGEWWGASSASAAAAPLIACHHNLHVRPCPHVHPTTLSGPCAAWPPCPPPSCASSWSSSTRPASRWEKAGERHPGPGCSLRRSEQAPPWGAASLACCSPAIPFKPLAYHLSGP